ncbi:MAG: lipocalin family protein [Spirochaetes bacterium]|jgi:apolipoprotein D and lipocalin family protein|nr:lipocalin family protein [Spirochaetota bacterium]
MQIYSDRFPQIVRIIMAAICIILLPSALSLCSKATIDRSTVDNFDQKKFMGVWYEIARFPHRFEKDLVGVTATYKLDSSGTVSVINQGYKNTLSGELKKAEGKARPRDKNSNKGELEVSFFLFFYSDYNILELDENYTHALIGSSSENYLWILSRTPQMDDDVYERLVKRAKERGYDTSLLEKVEQK